VNEGSRYFPIFELLKRGGESEVTLTFAEIELLIGGSLPTSARAARAWWSNRDSGAQASAWMQAGYRVVSLDTLSEHVTFRKHQVEYRVQRVGDAIQWDGDAIRALRAHMSLNQTAFAGVLGVRQQTVSEWEKGVYFPTRSTAKHLTRVAKEASFIYITTSDEQSE
jgi:DNA-binding transcriptional regulator YiaG